MARRGRHLRGGPPLAGRDGLWRLLGHIDAVHGLYYLLMHAVFAVWDGGPVALRLPLLSGAAVYARLHDLALAESPVASGTLQGTELPAPAIRHRIRTTPPRVVALSDPPGRPLDPYPQEAAKCDELRRHFVVCGRIPVWGALVTVYARPGRCGG